MPKKPEQWQELLYQALETELGGIEIYENAIECAVNDDLKEEWEKYLEQTKNHERVLSEVFEKLDLDETTETPGRAVVRHLGESLVRAMQMARQAGNEEAAEIVAAECVVLAETKDHANWELLKELCANVDDDTAEVLQAAVDEVEDEEDEHLYHTMGWARELWLQSLGLEAVLPPMEEKQEVKSLAAEARVKETREQQLKRSAKGNGKAGVTRSRTTGGSKVGGKAGVQARQQGGRQQERQGSRTQGR